MSYGTPAALKAAASSGASSFAHRSEDLVSGRITPILPFIELPELDEPPLPPPLLPQAATVSATHAPAVASRKTFPRICVAPSLGGVAQDADAKLFARTYSCDQTHARDLPKARGTAYCMHSYCHVSTRTRSGTLGSCCVWRSGTRR